MNKTDLLLILKIAGTSLEHVTSEELIARELDLLPSEIESIYSIIQKSITEEA
jgi:ABC-type antimicrobial peptide transport system permease subunit